MRNFVYNTTRLPNNLSVGVDTAASGNTAVVSNLNGNTYGITNNMTVSAWVYYTKALPTTGMAIVSCSNTATLAITDGWLLSTAQTIPRFQFSTFDSARRDSNSTATISLNTWYHVAGVYDGALVHIYVNGVRGAATQATTTNITVNAASRLSIGRTGTGSGGLTAGNIYIDEVTLWNVGFNNSELYSLYNSGRPTRPTSHSRASNLQVWYRMGDGDTYPNIKNRAPGGLPATAVLTGLAATNIRGNVPWRG